jgi:hypothetical protein
LLEDENPIFSLALSECGVYFELTQESKTLLHSLRKIVLMLMMAITVLSPFMQLDSWDNFPTSTDDLELQIIFGLCIIGMFLVFVGVVKLLPQILQFLLLMPAKAIQWFDLIIVKPLSAGVVFSPPLRI